MLRDRDGISGEQFRETAKWMGIREVLTAPQSPWQNAYAERLIGSIRRECLDHVIVFREAGLRRILRDYFAYYERCRTLAEGIRRVKAGSSKTPQRTGVGELLVGTRNRSCCKS
jgi:transposase InsO family protein